MFRTVRGSPGGAGGLTMGGRLGQCAPQLGRHHPRQGDGHGVHVPVRGRSQGLLGINLPARSAFSNPTGYKFSFPSDGRLCGTNALPPNADRLAWGYEGFGVAREGRLRRPRRRRPPPGPRPGLDESGLPDDWSDDRDGLDPDLDPARARGRSRPGACPLTPSSRQPSSSERSSPSRSWGSRSSESLPATRNPPLDQTAPGSRAGAPASAGEPRRVRWSPSKGLGSSQVFQGLGSSSGSAVPRGQASLASRVSGSSTTPMVAASRRGSPGPSSFMIPALRRRPSGRDPTGRRPEATLAAGHSPAPPGPRVVLPRSRGGRAAAITAGWILLIALAGVGGDSALGPRIRAPAGGRFRV